MKISFPKIGLIIGISVVGLFSLILSVDQRHIVSANEPVKNIELTSRQAITTTAFMPLFFNAFDQFQPPESLISSTIFDIPSGHALSCEHNWNIRLTTHSFSRHEHTQDIDFSACNTGTDSPTMFAAMTLAHPDPENPGEFLNNQSGMIVQTMLNSSINQR